MLVEIIFTAKRSSSDQVVLGYLSSGLCEQRISALTLAGKISASYETAWYLLCRIRKAIEARDAQYTLGGIIEFDDPYSRYRRLTLYYVACCFKPIA